MGPVAKPGVSPPTTVATVAKMFRALADPARLRLLQFLLAGERTVAECGAHMGLSERDVSAHLACLYDSGCVRLRRRDSQACYQVTDPRIEDLVLLARALAVERRRVRIGSR